MRQTIVPLLTVAILASCACSSGPGTDPRIQVMDAPGAPGSGEPNLVVGADGKLYLSWLEPAGDGAHALRFSVWQEEGWSLARTIATGKDWFVNWADFPSMAALEDGTLAAHWLAKSGKGTYAYDVRLSLSKDGGASWSEPLTPHTDGTETEHGFVSIVPAPDGGFDVVWLDGREMALASDGGAHGAGAMTLRSARVDRDGTIRDPRLIDDRVCDCCQTDAVRTSEGALVVTYRDRSATDVRDISTARLAEDGWAAPDPVHEDHWVISACPVNGPAVASRGRTLAVAWFTAGEKGRGRVNVAFSGDGGRSFSEPVRVDEEKPAGRVDLTLIDERQAVVSWLEEGQIRLRWVGADGPLSYALVLAETGETRAGGFPRIAHYGEELFLAWTEPGEPGHVHTARLPDVATR